MNEASRHTELRPRKSVRVLVSQKGHVDIRIASRGVQVLVTEQRADIREAGAALQQVGRTTVTEHVTMRFHDLRHSAASLLLAQGVSPKMIADLLGHSRIGITMDLYSHILPAMRRDTADAMDQILGSRS
jgi:integrase